MHAEKPANRIRTHIKDLSLLFGIPITIILVIMAFLYIPRLFAHPGYDFIYCEGYDCNERYAVDSSGKVTERPDEDRYSFDPATLYYYDVDRDTSRPLWGAEDAARYRLDPTSKSPDGYTLRHNTGGGGFLFWDSYQNSWSLSKGIVAKPITLDYGRGSDKQFMGWVVK